MNKLDSKRIVLYFTLFLAIAIGFSILFALRQFVDAFLGAVMVYITARPLMRYFIVKLRWKKSWSALTVIIISVLVVTVPLYALVSMVAPRIIDIFSDASIITNAIHFLDAKVMQWTGMEIFNDENLRKFREAGANYASSALSETVSIFGDVAMLIFILYFMLANTGSIEKFFENNIPISKSNIKEFAEELHSMTISNAVGVPVMAIIQGIVATVGYWICGLPDAPLWGIVTGVCSFVPVVGSALVWLPAGIYMLSVGNTWQSVGILITGIIISVSDNILRFTLLRKFADVHPLVTVFGVIVGIHYFGIPGIIFGPLLIAYLLILFKILKQELVLNSSK
ncbi:MAG: AI-2E family transporter [Bacteroidetes bacterium]|nr:AI-2E family transporter [Bacteroidota bacterium]